MAEITWAEALKEAEDTAGRDQNLWAQCFAESDGDEGKARALYVKRRMHATAPAPTPAPAKAPAVAPTSGWCPNCSSECKLDASTCQMCGADFTSSGWKPTPYKPTPRPSPEPAETEAKAKGGGSIWKWILGVPVGGFVLMMVIGSCAGNSPDGKERARSRDAISFCWKEQSKKSLSDSTARFVAGTCERMESEFRSRWDVNP